MRNLIAIFIIAAIIIGCSKENPLSTIEEFVNYQDVSEKLLLSFRLPGLDYEFHYLTILQDSVAMSDPFLGKELALMTLATLRRWTNEDYGNFANEGKRGAYVNKIEACINQIEAGAYQGARQKLINDIIPFAEANLTGPFLWTNGLLLESALASLLHPDQEIDVDESYLTVINATAYSIQHAVFYYIDGIGGITVPEPTLEDSLRALTQAMAMALANSENRSILLNQLTQSEDEEHKILIADYLSASTGNGYTILHSLSISSGYRDDYLQNFVYNHPDWTTYFPVEEHYAEWVRKNGNFAPITACDPLVDEECVEEILSYDEHGASLFLSPQTIPIEPTLFISPEPLAPPETIFCGFRALNKENPTFLVNRIIKVTYFHLYNDHEPWYRGAPEIYTKCYRDSYYQKVWFDSGIYNVDNECQSYSWDSSQWRTIWNYSSRCLVIKIWESDWPDAHDLVENIDPAPANISWFYTVIIGSTAGARIGVRGWNGD